ncbi:MAG: hypothetical protein HYX84_04070 [Chloroflexi bacterium]|nr:hypothetical protein [Chloroflexota bacterium]
MDVRSAAQELLDGIDNASAFPSTQFPFPLNMSLFGKWLPDELCDQARNVNNLGIEDQVSLIMALAEAREASSPDKAACFIGDTETRALVLRLNRSTGWALVWGENNEETRRLASLLRKEDFLLFTMLPEEAAGAVTPVKNLGSRPTASIYFYQALVRYAHIYGRIPLGEGHDVGDFIQDNGHGVMFLLRENLKPVEEALFLGGLALGIPAVVPSTFKSPYGNLLVADEPEQMVQKGLSLPTMKTRRHLHYQTNLPFRFDFAFTSEEIKEGKSIGGTANSSFVVTNEDRGDGLEVVGAPGSDVAIEIAVGDPRVDLTMTDYLEEFAARLPAYIEGVTAAITNGCPTIRWRSDLPLEMAHLAQAYYAALKAHFNLAPLRIRIIFQSDLLPGMKEKSDAFREKRKRVLASAREETEPFFYACTRCQAFAPEHACILTPERPSECGTRSWSHIKVRASLSEFDSGGLTKLDVGPELQVVVNKGQCLDQVSGEYTGVNSIVQRLTKGRTGRVFLHSIFDYPHTGCSCFQCVAFYIPEVGGIGVMDKTYKGMAPDGRSWDDVANAVAGKQSAGFAPLGRLYMKSGKFLAGDGGWRRVVWMPGKLKGEFASDKDWIATEEDVKDMEELREFLKAKDYPWLAGNQLST